MQSKRGASSFRSTHTLLQCCVAVIAGLLQEYDACCEVARLRLRSGNTRKKNVACVCVRMRVVGRRQLVGVSSN